MLGCGPASLCVWVPNARRRWPTAATNTHPCKHNHNLPSPPKNTRTQTQLHPDVRAFFALLQTRLHEPPPSRAEALATARLVAAFARLLLLLGGGDGETGEGAPEGGGVGALLGKLSTLSDRALSQLRWVDSGWMGVKWVDT